MMNSRLSLPKIDYICQFETVTTKNVLFRHKKVKILQTPFGAKQREILVESYIFYFFLFCSSRMKITMLTRMLSQIGLNFMNCHHKKINSAPALFSHHFFWCSLIKLGKMKKKKKKKRKTHKSKKTEKNREGKTDKCR